MSNPAEMIIERVALNDLESVKSLLAEGADPNARSSESGLNILMMAAGQANPTLVKLLLDNGADVHTSDSRAGASALHKACQGGNVEAVRLLVEHGSFVDVVAPTTGHTPLMDALWFKWPDIVEYLLEKGAGLKLSTHYGFSLLEHFEYELNVNVIGKDLLLKSEEYLKARQKSDEEKVENQKLMAAVNENDLEKVRQLIARGENVDERYPVLNGFNDLHTPLLVACRDGHEEIAEELINAGADINAVEPTFGAVPLHKATYNGHTEIARMLTEQPQLNINFQGYTNGYTALHDALWHGYDKCAEVLINAGARLDLRAHDGLTPLEIASRVFSEDHYIIRLLKEKGASV